MATTGFATPTKAYNSQPLNIESSAYNSSSKKYTLNHFQWQAEPTGNNTASPGATLNLLYGTDPASPTETGLSISPKGLFTFAPGQTFPGSGTITGVTAGTDLTGGGTSGDVTLNLDTTKVPQLHAANTFTGTQTVNGFLSTTSGQGTAIVGSTTAEGYNGVWGIASATSGGSNGVYGSTQDVSGAGVAGVNYSTSMGNPVGVLGSSANGTGVEGAATGASAIGVFGAGFNAPSGSGLRGGDGVYALGGYADPNGIQPGGTGVVSYGGGGGTTGFDGSGGYFYGAGSETGTGTGDGVVAFLGSGYAGNFIGDVFVTGTVSKAGGNFKIDHPLDPANKYLSHSFVESPDMMNIYNGIATLDANGEASVQMPEWFSVLNRDFRYQLTCIGGFAPVYIAEKLSNNRFKIGGGHAGMEVSWQITGIRQDRWANAHRIPVEEEKDSRLKGFYIHPELYGAPPEKQIEWARHPQMMKKMEETRQGMKEKQARPTRPAASSPANTK